MATTGCNSKSNYCTPTSKLMPGLALTMDKVVREFRQRLSTLLSVSVSTYNRQLFSVSSYNRDLGSETTYKRQILDLSGGLSLGSTPKDDLNYVEYFYYFNPFHVNTFYPLFYNLIKTPLNDLKNDFLVLNFYFTGIFKIYTLISKYLSMLDKSIEQTQQGITEVDSHLSFIIEKIKDYEKITNHFIIQFISDEIQDNGRKIDSSIRNIGVTITKITEALEKHVKGKIKEINDNFKRKVRQSLSEFHEELKNEIAFINSDESGKTINIAEESLKAINELIKNLHITYMYGHSQSVDIDKSGEINIDRLNQSLKELKDLINKTDKPQDSHLPTDIIREADIENFDQPKDPFNEYIKNIDKNVYAIKTILDKKGDIEKELDKIDSAIAYLFIIEEELTWERPKGKSLNIFSAIQSLTSVTSEIQQFLDKIPQAIYNLKQNIRFKGEEFESLSKQIPELKEIKEAKKQLEEHKTQLYRDIEKLKSGNRESKLTQFKDFVGELIESGTYKSIEATSFRSYRGSSSGDQKTVHKDLEYVQNQLSKIDSYRKIMSKLKVITTKLNQAKPDDVGQHIIELQELEHNLAPLESSTPRVTSRSLSGTPTPPSSRHTISSELKNLVDFKENLKIDKSNISDYEKDILDYNPKLGDQKEKTLEKLGEITSLNRPINSVKSDVDGIYTLSSSILTLSKLSPNMERLKTHLKSIDEETSSVEKVKSLEIQENNEPITQLTDVISETLRVIPEKLTAVKDRVKMYERFITIDTQKKPVEREVDKIKLTIVLLNHFDQSIEQFYKLYCEQYEKLKTDIIKLEKAIESVVRDFIECSLESLGDSLRKMVVLGYDYRKVRQVLACVLNKVTSELSDSISQLLQSHSSLYLSVYQTYTNTQQLINSMYNLSRLVRRSISNSKTHITRQLEDNKRKISKSVQEIEANIDSIDSSLRQYVQEELKSITTQFKEQAKKPFIQFYDKMSPSLEFIKGGQVAQGDKGTKNSEGSKSPESTGGSKSTKGTTEKSEKTNNSENTVDIKTSTVKEINKLIPEIQTKYPFLIFELIDVNKLSEENVDTLNKELPALKQLIEGLEESKIDESVNPKNVTLEYENLGTGQEALQGFTKYVDDLKEKREKIDEKKQLISDAFNDIKPELDKLDKVKLRLDELGKSDKTTTIISDNKPSVEKIDKLLSVKTNIGKLVSQLDNELKTLESQVQKITEDLDTIKGQLKGPQTTSTGPTPPKTPNPPTKLTKLEFMKPVRGLKHITDLNDTLKGYKGGTPVSQQTQCPSQPSSGKPSKGNIRGSPGTPGQPNTCKPNLKEIRDETSKLKYDPKTKPNKIENIGYFKGSKCQGGNCRGGSCPGGCSQNRDSQGDNYSKVVSNITDTVESLQEKLKEIDGPDKPNTCSSSSNTRLTKAKEALQVAKVQLGNLTMYGKNIGNIEYITKTITHLQCIEGEIKEIILSWLFPHTLLGLT